MTCCPLVPPHNSLITPVTDRPGHDRRYAIDPTRISSELGWQPHSLHRAGDRAAITPSGTAREAKADWQAES